MIHAECQWLHVVILTIYLDTIAKVIVTWKLKALYMVIMIVVNARDKG